HCRLSASPRVPGPSLRRAAPARARHLDEAEAVGPALRRVPRRRGGRGRHGGSRLQRLGTAGCLLAAGLRGAHAGHRYLFETRLTFERLRPGPKPFRPLLNGLEEGKAIRRSAIGTLMRKFRGGPGVYEGLFELLARFYRALADGAEHPVLLQQVREVNRLADALKPERSR